jgi:hypothetical protein
VKRRGDSEPPPLSFIPWIVRVGPPEDGPCTAPPKRHRSGAALVFHCAHRPRARDVVGVITKRAIADAVIENYDD